ncbi:MAG: Fe-Mn family superoxide dismutase [Patescibacteria group bacterium]
MQYEPKNFDHLLGLTGFSDAMLKSHFTLYQGYVTNTNKLSEEMETTIPGTPQYAELKRRFGWEWNGMRLHELYFGNMSPEILSINKESELYKNIEKEWGSLDMWEKDFRAMGVMRGIGWIILYHDVASGKLFNVWINEHDVGHLAGATPLLVMDVFEHAYISDYGLKRADYIEAFMKAIDWGKIEKRFLE